MDFGEKLKNLRLDRRETLHVVSMGTNIDMTLLSKFERGERLPTSRQIERIAGYFGLDKKQLAVEATAGKILAEYGYNDVTYGAAMFVQGEMQKYYANGGQWGQKMNNCLRVASFFSGIGGFDLGLERAGMNVVFQCEINEFCKKVLKKHWPNVPLESNILELNADDIPEAELWAGGFPCQDVSLANQGKRKGLEGFRSGLFYKYAELISERLPRWILVENVPGLLNSNNGKDFKAVISALDEFGYCVSWRILDAKYFGTPQRRRRVYIVASLGTLGSAEVLFESGANQQVYRAGLGKKDLVASGFGIGLGKEPYYLLQHATIGRKATAGPQAKGYRNDGEAYTLDSRGSSDVVCSTVAPFRMREVAGISPRLDGNRYRAVGNAVAVPIIEWLGRRISEVDARLYKETKSIVYDFDYESISTVLPSRVSKVPANIAGYGSP